MGFREEENNPCALSRSNGLEGRSVEEEADADVDGANNAVEEVLVVVDHSLERRAANDSGRRAGGRKGLLGRSASASASASASLSSLAWLSMSVSIPLSVARSRWSARIDAEWDAMAARISDVGRKVYPAVFMGGIATELKRADETRRDEESTGDEDERLLLVESFRDGEKDGDVGYRLEAVSLLRPHARLVVPCRVVSYPLKEVGAVGFSRWRWHWRWRLGKVYPVA
jgi:hypothetical protein